MPEIKDRDLVDERATARLASLFGKQRRRVAQYGAQVPPGEWQIQHEEVAALLLLLLDDVYRTAEDDVFRSAAGLVDRPQIRQFERGAIPADGAAEKLAAEIVRSTREHVASGGELDTAYGRARAENIGVTEITRARVAGEQAAVAELRKQGVAVKTIWRTEQDEAVCAICFPLDGEDEFRYAIDFPDGPPAHPRCRCTLEYEFTLEAAA